MQFNSSGIGSIIITLLCPVLLLSQSQTSLAPYRKGSLWGYANPETGRIVVPPTLDSVGLFRREEWYDNPIAWVKKNGWYGLMNTTGKVVLPIQELSMCGLVKIKNGFFAAVHYPLPKKMIQQVAVVKDDVVIDKDGYEEIVFQLNDGNTLVDKVRYEKEEEAVLTCGNVMNTFENAPLPVAFFDAQGYSVGPAFIYEWQAYEPFMESERDPNGFELPPDSGKSSDAFEIIWEMGKMGVFDLRKGKVVVAPAWTRISIHGRIAIAQISQAESQVPDESLPTTLIDLTTGKQTILPDSIVVNEHQGNSKLILAHSKKTHLFGFLDKTGRIVIPFQFAEANPFPGMASLSSGDRTT